MNEYDRFLDRLKKARRVLVASHYNPDGDAIGSTLVMGMFLEALGKDMSLYNRDRIPANLKFLPGSAKITDRISSQPFDLAIMVDCAQRKRVSDEFASCKFGSVGCIDHHLFEKGEADFELIDEDAASAGEVILRLMRRSGFKLSPEISQCIYTTLVVDTGFFKYSNTGAGILALASELVLAGASPWEVAKNLEESHPAERFRLLCSALSTLSLDLGGRYATMDVTRAMLAQAGATMDLSDEFATFPRSIEGVEVSALFREVEGGRIKVSMRSKDMVDVAAIARGFGGGGHARAAGFYMKAAMKDAKGKVRAAIEHALEGGRRER